MFCIEPFVSHCAICGRNCLCFTFPFEELVYYIVAFLPSVVCGLSSPLAFAKYNFVKILVFVLQSVAIAQQIGNLPEFRKRLGR